MKSSKYRTAFKLYFLVVVAFVTIISCLFWASGDDIAFARWVENGIALPNLITVFGVNGRYLGNTLGVLFSYLSMSSFWWIRALVNATCIILLMVFSGKLITINNPPKFPLAFCFISIGIIGANIYCWLEFYAYSAGFMNYFLPTLLWVIVLFLGFKIGLSPNLKQTIVLSVLVFANCLFIEHITVYIVLSCIAFFFYTTIFKKSKKLSLPLMISALIGIGCMFAYPLICVDESSTYRKTIFSEGLYLIFENIANNISTVLLDHLFLTFSFCGIGFLLIVFNFKKYSLSKKLFALIFIVNFILTAVCALLSYFGEWSSTPLAFLVAPATKVVLSFSSLIILGFLINWHLPNDTKHLSFFLYFSVWVICGILSCVSPLGPRCFFIVYTFLVLLVASLWLQVYQLLPKVLKSLLVTTCLLFFIAYSCFVTYSYAIGHRVQMERQNYLSQKLSEGATTVYVADSVNFTDCGGLRFLKDYYYYETPGDVEIKFIPYNEWKDCEY